MESNQTTSTWISRIKIDCLFVDFADNTKGITALFNTPIEIEKLPIGYELTRGEHIIHCLEEPDVVAELFKFNEIDGINPRSVDGLLNVLTILGMHDVVETYDA